MEVDVGVEMGVQVEVEAEARVKIRTRARTIGERRTGPRCAFLQAKIVRLMKPLRKRTGMGRHDHTVWILGSTGLA